MNTPKISMIGLLLGAAGFGCGGDWKAETHPVSGRVIINGKAPQGAVVTLHAVGEKVDKRNSRPWGIVQDDGTFTLSTYERGDGAPAGEYDVTIKWPEDVTDLSKAMTDRLGGRYSQPEQSQWRVTVQEGNNVLKPIMLKNVKVDMSPGSAKGRKPPLPAGPKKSAR